MYAQRIISPVILYEDRWTSECYGLPVSGLFDLKWLFLSLSIISRIWYLIKNEMKQNKKKTRLAQCFSRSSFVSLILLVSGRRSVMILIFFNISFRQNICSNVLKCVLKPVKILFLQCENLLCLYQFYPQSCLNTSPKKKKKRMAENRFILLTLLSLPTSC